MSAKSGEYFDRATSIVDAHDALQAAAGNATLLNQFLPVEDRQKRMAEALLWLFYNLGLCCKIVSGFAMYIGGKLIAHH